jgi:hypothetical protein
VAASLGFDTQGLREEKNHEKVNVVSVAVEIRTSDNTCRERHQSNQLSRRSDSRTESTVTHFSIEI